MSEKQGYPDNDDVLDAMKDPRAIAMAERLLGKLDKGKPAPKEEK